LGSSLTRPAQAASGARSGRRIQDAVCRSGGQPTSLLEIIRGPQADLLLFAGIKPTREAAGVLRRIEQCVYSLGSYLHAHFVFVSEADARDAGFDGDDAKVIVDGQERLQAAFGIRDPEDVYIRPDGYIGFRARDPREQTLLDYLRLIYTRELIH
jgi:hypothetical protein